MKSGLKWLHRVKRRAKPLEWFVWSQPIAGAAIYLIFLDTWFIALYSLFPYPGSINTARYEFWHHSPAPLVTLVGLIWLIHISWTILLSRDCLACVLDRSVPYRTTRILLDVWLIAFLLVKAVLIHKLSLV